MLSIGGYVVVAIGSYNLTTSLGVFIILLVAVFYCLSLIFRTLSFVKNTPKSIAVYNNKKSHTKGLQALAYGLSAVAAGDIKSAKYYTKRATKFMTDDFGLSALLSGLTARLSGDEKQASKSFQSLLKHRETSYLGLRGLMQVAIEKGDIRYANVLANKAYDQNPKQPWVIQTLYDLKIRSRDYIGALELLPKLVKTSSLAKSKLKKQEAILRFKNNEIIRSYKLYPSSLPIALGMLKDLSVNNKRRKSLNIIKKIWGDTPHPKLLDYWIKYAPKKTHDNRLALIAWMEALHQVNSKSASGSLYIGEAILNLGQGEQAARFLKQAIKANPTSRAYQLMHRIDVMGGWMDNVPTATSDKTWICTKTGKIFDKWHAVNDAGDFNSIKWAYPNKVRKNQRNGLANTKSYSLFDVSKAA